MLKSILVLALNLMARNIGHGLQSVKCFFQRYIGLLVTGVKDRHEIKRVE